jgi:hypothetical protein
MKNIHVPVIHFFVRTFHGLDPLVFSDLELTSEAMNPFGNFRRNPWEGDRPIVRPIPIQDSTKHENMPIPHASSGIRITTPGFERFKAIRAFDRAPTGIGC